MEDENFIISVTIGIVIGVFLTILTLFLVVDIHEPVKSSQEDQIKELKQQVEIIELNKKILKLKEVK